MIWDKFTCRRTYCRSTYSLEVEHTTRCRKSSKRLTLVHSVQITYCYRLVVRRSSVFEFSLPLPCIPIWEKRLLSDALGPMNLPLLIVTFVWNFNWAFFRGNWISNCWSNVFSADGFIKSFLIMIYISCVDLLIYSQFAKGAHEMKTNLPLPCIQTLCQWCSCSGCQSNGPVVLCSWMGRRCDDLKLCPIWKT